VIRQRRGFAPCRPRRDGNSRPFGLLYPDPLPGQPAHCWRPADHATAASCFKVNSDYVEAKLLPALEPRLAPCFVDFSVGHWITTRREPGKVFLPGGLSLTAAGALAGRRNWCACRCRPPLLLARLWGEWPFYVTAFLSSMRHRRPTRAGRAGLIFQGRPWLGSPHLEIAIGALATAF
jgi:hypothetical protein